MGRGIWTDKYLPNLNGFLSVMEGRPITIKYISENESTIEGQLLFSHYINGDYGTEDMLKRLTEGDIKDEVKLFMKDVNNIENKNCNLFSETAKGVIIVVMSKNNNLHMMLIDDHVYRGHGKNLEIKSGEHVFSTEKEILELRPDYAGKL